MNDRGEIYPTVYVDRKEAVEEHLEGHEYRRQVASLL
jgi:hypothetical protein